MSAQRLILLGADEGRRRNRRTIDAVAVVGAALVMGFAALLATFDPQTDAEVGEALITVLGWAPALWRAAFVAALLLVLAIATEALLRRRATLARDLLAAAFLVAAAGALLRRLVENAWLAEEPGVWSPRGFPEVHIACVPRSWRSRPRSWSGRSGCSPLVRRAGARGVVLGPPSSGALGALALGLGAGAVVRLVFGSAAGVPTTARVRDSLAALGVEVADLAPRPRSSWAPPVRRARPRGAEPGGARARTRCAGHPAARARWRLLVYRDPPRSVAPGRLEQVEHEALAILMAAEAGVRVPEVVTAGLGPDGDAILVTRQPNADPLELATPDEVTDATLRRSGARWRTSTRPASPTAG